MGLKLYLPSQEFLYIVPLKQGLKHSLYDNVSNFIFPFLYIVPLKQGLKQANFYFLQPLPNVFIHSSIKTRIETT